MQFSLSWGCKAFPRFSIASLQENVVHPCKKSRRDGSLSPRLHALLQMLSNELFTTFRVRASASSLMGWH
jgi:hypothetical protein